MRKTSLLILACGMAAGFYTPASAQLNIDCGNPQNAITYYCNNRDQFTPGSAAAMGALPSSPYRTAGGAPSVPVTSGPVMVEPYDPVATGSIVAAPPPAGMVPGGIVVAPRAAPPAIDCGNPQNAITYYCMNRDQFR